MNNSINEIIKSNKIDGRNSIIVIKEKGIALIFARNRKDKYAFVNYDEGLLDEIKKYTWTYVAHNKRKEYFKAGSKNYYLHHLVKDYYCGKEKRFKKQKERYVIDHLDNNGLNNMTENLHFLTFGENSSKQSIDRKAKIINDIGRYYIYYMRDNGKGNYHLTIRDNTTDEYRYFIYLTYDDLKADLKYILALIQEGKLIPLNHDELRSKIICENIKSFPMCKALQINELINTGTFDNYYDV